MSAIISEIIKDSIAEEIGLNKGDVILKLNDIEPIDYIDYQFLTKTELLTIETETEIFEIEKDFDEDLGVVFESAVFDKVKPCTNKCIFCFVDQQPKGLRPSLYIKDDDYRLSYLQGTYITLTNLTVEDKKRIETLSLGPLYISVHTTNPELRVKMLNNPKAANIMKELKWLQKVGIPIHAQIVLCPDYNDGEQLQNTLNNLAQLKDILLSVAVVPVGVTKFREEQLKLVDKTIAKQTIQQINEFNKKLKRPIAQVSDEFFLIGEQEIPPKKYYANFAQIEDGVGALRLLLDDFKKNEKQLPKSIKKETTIHLVTSKTAQYTFEQITTRLNEVKNLNVNTITIESKFWGDKISVAGLIVGEDIINQLTPMKDQLKTIIISSVMLKPYSKEFLDGITVEQIEKKLGCKISVIENYYSTTEMIALIKSYA